jgi:ATP adenylyltransferase/5',5'''-P-1,P-4-tetraphosphate phosphorylase II
MITPNQISALFDSQLADWQQAGNNYEALNNVVVKQFDVDGFNIKVQFNPARIASSSAKVDTKSIKERKCFLCAANRPAIQTGIDWNERYTILINPFPIFPRHLTIPDKSHTDQLIKGRIADMMQLASELRDFTVFYNGPKCGASAPDHMHFQAGNSDFLTLGNALQDAPMQVLIESDGAKLQLVDSLPLKVFVIDAKKPQAGEVLFNRLYAALPIPEGESEPMMNLLCYTRENDIRLVVIPRKRHRPSFYGTEDDQMLLSPASVDMGGVFITPLKKDFDRIDATTIRTIYNELCLTSDEAKAIASQIK